MSIFDRLLTQPIFNILALIYSFIADFGVAIIVLTILIRFLLWPLIKKQLHQTKLMRSIQPELKRIKQQTKGNRMLESQMMMELYREKGIKPFSSMLVLFIQLPVLIAVFSVVQLFNMNLPAKDAPNYQQAVEIRSGREAKLKTLAYPGIADIKRVKDITNDPEGFKPKLFGLIDLTKTAGEYFPAMTLVLLAAALQFFQSKQIMPSNDKKRKLRDMFKEAAAGKEVDQAEMAAATTGKMIYFFPIMTFMIGLALPAAVMLYYATGSLVAVIQQHILLNKDLGEMEKLAGGATREKKAIEAEIVTRKPSKTSSKSSGGQTVVRRIKAK